MLPRWWLVDAPCEDELSAKQAEVVASFIDATCVEDANTLTATEKNSVLSFAFSCRVFELENALSRRRSIRYCAKNDTVWDRARNVGRKCQGCVHPFDLSSQPCMLRMAGACSVQECRDLRVDAFRFQLWFSLFWSSFWLVSHVQHVLLFGNARNNCQTCC